MNPRNSLTIGTRGSQLARWQTDHVIARLKSQWPGLNCTIRTFITTGDRTLDAPLPAIGGKGVFTEELEAALRSGEIDIAVHSLKDLPVEDPPGLAVGAILGRADVRDVLITRESNTLQSLPPGAVVGTGSLRREAQLRHLRPDLNVRSIRGNVETRIRKVREGQYDATILAAAGLSRLKLTANIEEYLNLTDMLPAPGQGALAIQCRAVDEATLTLLKAIDNGPVRQFVTAERAFLHALGGGCAVPVAAYASSWKSRIHLEGLVAAPDGTAKIRVRGDGDDPLELGRRLAEEAIAKGAQIILDLVKPLRGRRIVVTRSPEQARPFAQLLSALGAEPVMFPVIRFEALPSGQLAAALAMMDEFDWLVFTSINGARYFFTGYDSHPDKPALPKIAAVGSATERFLLERGLAVNFVPEEYTGEQLAQGLGDLTGQWVLLPRARIGRPEIVEALRANGAEVHDIPLYDTVQAAPTAEAAAELTRGVDVITFTSPSSVRNFFDIMRKNSLDPWAGGREILTACIGPVTAEALKKTGHEAAIVPATYSIEGLVDALTVYYAHHKL